MRATWRLLTAGAAPALLLAALGWAAPVQAANCDGDQRVMGGYVLAEGEVLDDNLIVLGGSATLEPGSASNCDVIVVGGSVDVGGSIAGDVVLFGGSAALRGTAEIGGELVSLGGTVSREPGAQVQGAAVAEETAPDGATWLRSTSRRASCAGSTTRTRALVRVRPLSPAAWSSSAI